MHNIKNVEFSDIDFSNKDIILHLTSKEHEEDINKDGLIPQIGENSKDGLGYEKTPKVFFTKELDGSLMYVNKVLNIIAFVSLKENIIKTELEIRQDLLKKIPEYMCPKIKIIKEFPLNSNGKCDEKRLVEEFANGRKNY